jgi:hypothetical protein
MRQSGLIAERQRTEQAEHRLEGERQLVEDGRRRIDELQALLMEGRRQIDGLYMDLANTRTAAMVTGCEAATLRAENALLKARPWWRRWLR